MPMHRQSRKGRMLVVLLSALVVTVPPATLAADSNSAAHSKTPNARRGYAISARSDRSDKGFGDSRVEATMILRNAAGQVTERSLSFATLEKENETVGDKSLAVFNSPHDVEGTALLSHANILTPDDQWLYLPALKRVKRISSANKSGPFVGSEFAFEDFTATELNKYSYEWLREETVDGVRTDVVARFPRYENSGYTKQIAWIDQDVYQVRKVEFYDRKSALLKTLWLKDYRVYGGIWRSHKFHMMNHQTGKETDLLYGDFKFKTGLGKSDFTPGALERIR